MAHSTLGQVLSIPELLVQILGHLDVRTLLIAQRVCRTWATQIQRSTYLQQALFLAPAPSTEIPIYNPLLRETFPSFFPDIDDQNPSYLRTPGDCFPPLNIPSGPSYPEGLPAPEAPHDHPIVDDAARAGIFYGRLGPMAYPFRRPAWWRREASWRRMLIQQPPLPHLTVLRFWANSQDRTYAVWRIPGTINDISTLERYARTFDWPQCQNPQREEFEGTAGVRMGLLFDYLSCDLDLSRWALMWGRKAPISLAREWGDAFVEVYERVAADGDFVILTDEALWRRRDDDADVLPWTSSVTNPRNRIVEEYRQSGLIRDWKASYIMRVKPERTGHFDYLPVVVWLDPEEVSYMVQLQMLHVSRSSDDLLLAMGR
ncbi:uncharacterized protein BO80DRAFT_292012 [Aspergillus ibericus CBS 121593]|uniref:F-box domain-containing protein n=1 Tax=Aspergillus ibericus CBS 121593 TaxID=1448316 RepID=A0A395GJI7_9EURO|nr:hypothetical protein BO80DRAFT_292012 [Aspergillus ibericus CBS 121593]RAK94917.1 hypothetical protein BO80DRAFT_292012 [Aspergillus ibericus CBS 121593]